MERLTTMRDGRPVLAKGYEERFSEPSLFFMLLNRLAAYEDAMPLERAQELSQAEKDGRLVVLPPVSESASAFQKNLDIFELSIAIKWAHAAALMDENPEVSHLFLLSEIALNEKLERLVNAQPLSDQLAHEEAEAALKKREDQAHD